MLIVYVLWVCWCVMHSVLSDPFVTGYVQGRLPGLFRYYRLFYNGFSLLTLLPLIAATHMLNGPVVFSWAGYVIIGRVILLAMALSLFWAGAQHYDLHEFMGTRQARSGEHHTLMSDGADIFEGSIFAVTRHPWYLGTLLLIWSMLHKYTVAEFLVGLILSIYLVIGSLLEERKILAVYGDRYRQYQQKVSMLLPLKWLRSKLKIW